MTFTKNATMFHMLEQEPSPVVESVGQLEYDAVLATETMMIGDRKAATRE